MSGQVGWLELATSLVLVVFAAAVSVWQRLGLERQVLWAGSRALVQLLLVGGALTLEFEPGRSLWWSWVWIAGMVAYGADVARRRTPEVPRLAPLAVGAFAASVAITLAVIFGLGVFPLHAQTLVPVAGMMIGNSMTAMVLVTRRLVDELREKRDQVEARLALGQSARQAAAPYLRIALRSAISPQIETTKAIGLVFLPGAMSGLILGGVPPVQAVLIQAMLMFLILGSVAATAIVVALGLVRLMFTRDHRLLPLGHRSDSLVPQR